MEAIRTADPAAAIFAHLPSRPKGRTVVIGAGKASAQMRARGLDPLRLLAENDAWSAFAAVGDLVVTGPTGTAVNYSRVILIEA